MPTSSLPGVRRLLSIGSMIVGGGRAGPPGSDSDDAGLPLPKRFRVHGGVGDACTRAPSSPCVFGRRPPAWAVVRCSRAPSERALPLLPPTPPLSCSSTSARRPGNAASRTCAARAAETYQPPTGSGSIQGPLARKRQHGFLGDHADVAGHGHWAPFFRNVDRAPTETCT